MIASTVFLSLLGMVAALPASEAAPAHSIPETMTAKAFKLIVNVTDLDKDLKPPVHKSYLSSAAFGKDQIFAGISSKKEDGLVFYQNGTQKEFRAGIHTILSDSGMPPHPNGLAITKPKEVGGLEDVTIRTGSGTQGVHLNNKGDFSYMVPETFFVCEKKPDSPNGEAVPVIMHIDKQKDTDPAPTTPKNCVSIRLIPECSELQPLFEGSISKHDNVINSRCYKDVSKITWV